MKYAIKIAAILVPLIMLSCAKEEGCTNKFADNYDIKAEKDDGSCTFQSNLIINISHYFDGDSVSPAKFNLFDFVTENNDTISVSKLRYLLSDISLVNSSGKKTMVSEYQLVDMEQAGSSTINANGIEKGTYTLEFTFGFNAEDNAQEYMDLNSANWNWPDMIGGGYHFMQFEGNFLDDAVQMPFSYHYGTASNSGIHEENHFLVTISNVNLSGNNTTIDLKMDLAEWFKNPSTWNLSTYHKMLMGNYDAQKLMQSQGPSVFSLGLITNE